MLADEQQRQGRVDGCSQQEHHMPSDGSLEEGVDSHTLRLSSSSSSFAQTCSSQPLVPLEQKLMITSYVIDR